MTNFDLTDLETAKEYMRVNSTTDDALIGRIVTAASKFMLQDMNRSLGMQQQTLDERFDGTGQSVFQPRNMPLVSVQEVQIGTISVPQSTDFITAGWVLDQQRDRVVLIGYCFTLGMMNCRVKYTFGYATTPEDVEQACCELIALKYKRIKSINLVSEALPQGGGTVTFLSKDVPDDVRNVIEQYTVRF